MNTVGTSYGLSWLSDGILKGSLKITVPYSPQMQYSGQVQYTPQMPYPSQIQYPGQMQPQVQVYEFIVLRPDWDALEMLARSFQPRQVVPQQWHYPYLQW
jgi:hypothetical protein